MSVKKKSQKEKELKKDKNNLETLSKEMKYKEEMFINNKVLLHVSNKFSSHFIHKFYLSNVT